MKTIQLIPNSVIDLHPYIETHTFNAPFCINFTENDLSRKGTLIQMNVIVLTYGPTISISQLDLLFVKSMVGMRSWHYSSSLLSCSIWLLYWLQRQPITAFFQISSSGYIKELHFHPLLSILYVVLSTTQF